MTVLILYYEGVEREWDVVLLGALEKRKSCKNKLTYQMSADLRRFSSIDASRKIMSRAPNLSQCVHELFSKKK